MSYHYLRITEQVKLFRQTLNEIDRAFVQIETAMQIAADLEREGINPDYDAVGHVREFAGAMRDKLIRLLEIVQQENGHANS